MSNQGSSRIVKLCTATNNSSSESVDSSSTTTTTDGDVDLPMFESWYRCEIASPRYDTDHTSLAVQASNSSRSAAEEPPPVRAGFGILPNSPDSGGPSVAPQCSTTPLLTAVGGSTAAAMSSAGVANADRTNAVFGGGKEFGEGSSEFELSESSSNHLETLNHLQAELEETRAALELTEEQLTMKMTENDEAADEINNAWRMVSELHPESEKMRPDERLEEKHSKLLLHIFRQIEQEGGPERAWLSQDGLHAAIVHLYLAGEDAALSSKLTNEQAKEMSKKCQRLQNRLQHLVSGLQGILGDAEDGAAVNFDLDGDGDVAEGGEAMIHTLLEQAKAGLQSRELRAARWQMATAQLRRELVLCRRRCRDKTETLAERMREERQRLMREAAETERDRSKEQEETVSTLSAKVVSLEEELQIAKATCNELWEQHQATAEQLSAKTAQLEQALSSPCDMSGQNVPGTHSDEGNLPYIDHCSSDTPLDRGVIQGIHEQFDQQWATAEALDAERLNIHRLRNRRLAKQEAGCLTESQELAKNRQAYRDEQRQQQIARKKMDDERRHQEERVKEITQSLLEVTQDKGRMTLDLTRARQDAEVIKQQLVAATTALDYERQGNAATKVRCEKSEEQAADLQRQLASLLQDHRAISQKWADSERQTATLQAEASQHIQEFQRVSAELGKVTGELRESERRSSVAMATKELEANAKLTEGALTNSDLAGQVSAMGAEREGLRERVQSLERRLEDDESRKAELDSTKSLCERLQSKGGQMETELSECQSSLQDITSLKEQQDADLDGLQEELNSATNSQAVLRKKLRRQKASSESALKSLEEERDILTNQLTEVTKNLTNVQKQLNDYQEAKTYLSEDKQKLMTAYKTLNEQSKLDKNELQRALYQTETLEKELDEVKQIKRAENQQLAESVTKLVATETTLKEERSKVTALSSEAFTLKDVGRSQENQIAELSRQYQDLQLEFQAANHQNELQYNKLMLSSEKTISHLEKTSGNHKQELTRVIRENNKMEGELDLLNGSLKRKRTDYAHALLALHKSEIKEKEMATVISQLERQINLERNIQEELNKSFENQETELQKLRQTKHNNLDMEQLQNTLKTNTKAELQQIKDQLVQDFFSKMWTLPKNNPKDPSDITTHRVLELETEIDKLKGLRSVDKLTIASLTEDIQRYKKRLSKQKAAFLKHRNSSKPGADDIQAALAKAHVRALSMSMADYPADLGSPLFGRDGLLLQGQGGSTRVTTSHGGWETKSSSEDSLTAASSDEYSS